MKPIPGVVSEAELTTKEQAELARTEHVIEQAQRSFYDFGKGLEAIHAKKLYRPMTWEHYCDDRWDITAERARQLVQAADAYEVIKDHQKKSQQKVGILPMNEAHCRPLLGMDRKTICAIWDRVTETLKGRLHSDHVSKCASDIANKECQKQYEVPIDDYSEARAILPPAPERRPAAPSQSGSEHSADTCVARCRELAERQAKLGEKLEDEEKASWFVWNALLGQRILDGDFPPKAWLKQ